jgi:ribonuclease T2
MRLKTEVLLLLLLLWLLWLLWLWWWWLFVVVGCGLTVGLITRGPAMDEGDDLPYVIEGGKGAKEPKGFDFFVLSLSYSPTFCVSPAGKRNAVQCGRSAKPRGFVLHGLWPQYEPGGWPQSCPSSHKLDRSVVNSMLDLTPDPSLVRHEWTKHGTCSSLSAPDYFAAARRAVGGFRLPPQLEWPLDERSVTPQRIMKELAGANPDVAAASYYFTCVGTYLSEVRVCLDKRLRPRACPYDQVKRRCKNHHVTILPVHEVRFLRKQQIS